MSSLTDSSTDQFASKILELLGGEYRVVALELFPNFNKLLINLNALVLNKCNRPTLNYWSSACT